MGSVQCQLKTIMHSLFGVKQKAKATDVSNLFLNMLTRLMWRHRKSTQLQVILHSK